MGAGARARGHRGARRVRGRTRAARPAPGLSVLARGELRLAGFTWTPLGRRRPAVADLDLSVGAGERVLLAGPSGSGKSTVLRALAGLLGEATPGDATGLVEHGGTVGLLLQDPDDAQVAATVGRDVAFGPENAGLPRDRIWARVHEALEHVRLDLPDDHPARATSGGQRQRLALAGVLALRPDVLLLDEPTSMLDPASAAAVRASVVEVAERTGATLVLVEHRLAPWLEHVDRVVVLDAGRAVADLAPGAVAGDDSLARLGLWVPGVPPPVPTDVPDALVRPAEPPPVLRAEAVDVDLVARTLRGRVTRRALTGVDAVLPAGRVTAWTGPSGAGKSTLAAVLAGLIPPSRGRVTGVDDPPHRWTSAALARAVGWAPQQPEHGFLTRRVADEIALTGGVTGRGVDVAAVADALRLGHLLDADPFALSGGEQRRLALAAALGHRPGVVVLDEPTVGQDRGTWSAVAGWLSSAARASAAVGVASHDVDLVALADDRVRLVGGRVAT